ncbi:MAG TPA: DUF2062 domain-containing protein [Thermodesulfovibrionales bacterium]|nr:DUF2062 domain-containing protein [Thermodesulfovibrionales bacterium]
MALRDKLRLILTVKETPHRLSMAFASGIFIGMSPLLGLHTILGIVVAYIFKLNRFVTLMGVFVTNPWTIIPIYTFSTWVGAKCLGMDNVIPDTDWSNITVSKLLNELSPILKPFIVGTTLIGVLAALISYFVVYYMTKKKDV